MIDVTQKKIRANGTTLESNFRHSLLKPSMLTAKLEQQFADSFYSLFGINLTNTQVGYLTYIIYKPLADYSKTLRWYETDHRNIVHTEMIEPLVLLNYTLLQCCYIVYPR